MKRSKTESIRGTVRVEQFGDKVEQVRLRSFGCVLRKDSEYTGQRMPGKR